MHLHAIPAFVDNYVWALVTGHRAVVVDPGDDAPVRAFLDERSLQLQAILLTHHHPDHTGGVSALLERSPVPVYGPQAESARIPQLTDMVGDGDVVEVLGLRFSVMAVPGHTLGHIAYHAPGQPGILLCGDTLFSAGCGRLFEGTPQQMHASLQRLAALPDDTGVYCTHEYTLANLAFAAAAEPDNGEIAAQLERVRALRAAGQPSLPSTVRFERSINPFLRTAEPGLRAAAAAHAGTRLDTDVETFAALRRWKDDFRAA